MRSGLIYLSHRDLYWLAGLLEAEAAFMLGTPSQPRTPRMQIGMTDQDVIARVAHLLQSTIKRFRMQSKNLKPQYSIQIGGGSAVSLCSLIYSLMGKRRQHRIDELIASYKPSIHYGCREFRLADSVGDEGGRYWLAGYLEGEAYFALRTFTKPSRVYRYLHIEVGSTDRDVIEHAQQIWLNLYNISANIGSRQPGYEGSKLVHRIAAHGPKARTIMEDMYPLMGSRRQVQIREALEHSR